MRLRTLFLYLIGSREAILEIARSRHALWIGALFVLSAGFAREYDQEDLLHEPWYLLIPFGASLLTATLLFTLAYGLVPGKRKGWPSDWVAYVPFLTLFWMTAPLAWLYAIPYERFLSPMSATQANLITLGVVASWRVYLMARVLQVIMGYRVILSFFPPLLLGSLILLISSFFQSVSLVNIMSGVRESEEVLFLRTLHGWVCFLSGLVFPLCGAYVLVDGRSFVSVWNQEANGDPHQPFSSSLASVAVGSVLVWACILPWTQPEQVLRRQVETALAAGRIEEAVAVMNAHDRADFPPQWDPPPRYDARWLSGYNDLLWDVLEVVTANPQASWVRAEYMAKVGKASPQRIMHEVRYGPSGKESRSEQIPRILARLTVPERESVYANWSKFSHSEEHKDELRRFLKLKHGEERQPKDEKSPTPP
jgi:hypothetical protein